MIIYSCKHCSTRVTELIASVPPDGQEHFVSCPTCQHSFGVRKVPPDGVNTSGDDEKPRSFLTRLFSAR